MAEQHPKPVIFLAFANDRQQSGQYLRNLGQEAARVRGLLEQAEAAGLCELVERQSVTPEHLLEVFHKYQDRIAVFHYAGHAEDYALLLETAKGDHFAADARGLAAVLRHQIGLQLVFLNACSTRAQADELLDAGVRVVVATSRAVDDELATNFALDFYQLLAAGASIDTAFARATKARTFATGELTRHLRPVDVQQDHTADGWPWAMYVQGGAELARQWNLPQAAGDPLFGLPPLPELDLPASPYRHLEWYTREQAELFFGRGHQIRDLYQHVTEPGGAPIILLYGQSGVGKSSVLDAGLRPRLERDHITLYRRRDQARGLLGTLQDALGSASAAAWHEQEAYEGKPLVVIIDQLEEAFTRPNAQRPHELDEFLVALQDIFSDRTRRPQGKLLLGFRKEWLAELEKQLKDRGAPFSKIFLNRLDSAGILEVIHGPARSPRLRRRYGLTIDAALPREIADDLLADPRSPVATVLQILLTKLWEAACARHHSTPQFDRALYHQLKREGIGLDDFLTQQLQALHEWRPSAVDSGLALDLLAFHTTPLGTAEQRSEEEVHTTYAHDSDLPTLVQRHKDLYLLADTVEDQETATKPTRLAHDTLAPLVRKRFDESDAPGQRARRILESRAVDWKSDAQGTPLDTTDLAVVESGAAGMRTWTNAETRLVNASRAARRRRALVRRGAIGLLIVGVLVITGTAIIALRQREVAFSREFAASALSQLSVDPERSLLLAIEAAKRAPTSQAEEALRQSLQLSHVRVVMKGHEAELQTVAFSPDGKRVVTASFDNTGGDNTGRVWDAVTGGAIVSLNGHSKGVTSAAFSHTDGGQRIVTASYDSTARLWNASTGETLAVLSRHREALNGAVFSPDDKLVLTWSNDRTARLWDAATGHPVAILEGHNGGVSSAAFSRDGKRVVTGSLFPDGTARVWDTPTGMNELWTQPEEQRTAEQVVQQMAGARLLKPVATLDAHTKLVHSAAFSPDGTLVVTAGGDWGGAGDYTSTARVWEVATRKKVAEMRGHTDIVQRAEFSPSGERIVTASHDASARVWEARTGKQVAALIGHNRVVNTATFSPDGNFILTASNDNTGRLWEATTGRTLLELRGHTGSVKSATFSPDGTLVATASTDRTARLWQVSLVELRGHQGFVLDAAFSPDGKLVATASEDGTVRLWEAKTGQSMAKLDVGESSLFSGATAMFTVDGKSLLTTWKDGTTRVWDLTTRDQVAWLSKPPDTLVSIAFPDGTRVMTMHKDNTVRVWDVATRAPVATLSALTQGVFRAAFSPDGTRLVTSHKPNTVRVWEVATPKLLGELVGHTAQLLSAALSPDGTRVLTTHQDHTPRVWEVATEKLLELDGHAGWVTTGAFSCDGKFVVTGGHDGTARVWEAATGRAVAELRGHALPINDVAFSPDGAFIVTASNDRTALIYACEACAFDQTLVRRARQQITRELTPDERRKYLHEPLGRGDRLIKYFGEKFINPVQKWIQGNDSGKSQLQPCGELDSSINRAKEQNPTGMAMN